MKLSTSLLIWIGLALGVTNSAWSTENTSADAVATPTTITTEPPTDPWLADVQAQRQAWQAHREARVEAMKARRQMQDPWGEIQRQAMEDRSNELREATRQRTEQYRESRLAQHPPASPELEQRIKLYEARRQAREAQQQARREAMEQVRKEHEQAMFQPPPGWNNPWYFRGF